jgi:coenzyme F420-reducing hydrogenase gamma subunit
VKPLYDPVDSGQAVIQVLKAYGVTDYSKKVIVAYGDCAVVAGSIGLQRNHLFNI